MLTTKVREGKQAPPSRSGSPDDVNDRGKARGKARGVALAWWEWCMIEEATASKNTVTTMRRGALDGPSTWIVGAHVVLPNFLRACEGGEAHWSRDHGHHHEHWCPSRPVQVEVVPDGTSQNWGN
uniref:Uncharacterized protein n=1 Tax=Solanum tuberosum TaxID=4113 RepID=M1DHI6_SOLTU